MTIHIDEYANTVGAIATRVWRRYQGYIEPNDLRQEAAVWWYGKGQRYLADYLEDENLGRLNISLYRYLDGYARAAKAQIVGYEPRDQCRYSAREVHDLFPIALDPEGLPTTGYSTDGKDGPPVPKGNLAEGGDLLAALIDVRRALRQLSEEDIQFLTLADDCNYDWDRVALRSGSDVQVDSLRRRHARIAERCARWLSNEEEL